MVYNPDINALTMNTSVGAYTAPQLQKLSANDCITANYTIDFDNQPSGQPYDEATEIQYQLLSRYTVVEKQADFNDDYTDSIRSIQGVVANPFYYGHLFIMTEQAGTPSDSAYDYELIYHPDSVDAEGINTLFLKIKQLKGNSADNSLRYISSQAFDVSHLVKAYGKEVTEYKYLPFYLKYQIGMNENIPVYRQFGTDTITVAIFK
jgi:hypothetical protein